MTLRETALKFFDACETGKGWDACKHWCHEGASFSAQVDALEGIATIEGYTDWMKGMMNPLPDGHYDLFFFGVDEERSTVAGAAVFHATHTVDTEDIPATGKSMSADYSYIMKFDGDKISHMTKIWNDGFSLRQLGWA